MFIIKEEQIKAFESVRFPSFEEKMIKHVEDHFKPLAIALGKDALINLIHYSYGRAQKYGFTTRYEVCLFTDIMILLGNGFDTDPQFPWANEILIYGNIYDPNTKIDMLYENALEFLERVLHNDDVFPVSAFSKLSAYPLSKLEDLAGENMEEGMLIEFDQLWEHKYNNVDEGQLRLLIKRGIQAARKHGFSSDQAIGYYILLMFFLGHRFDIDPQYPWVSTILNDQINDQKKVGLLQNTVNKNILSDIYGVIIKE